MEPSTDFAIAGEPAHTRCAAIALRLAEGDRIAFRADILDLRKAGLMELAGAFASAGIIHKMEVVGHFAWPGAEITDVAWSQSHVAHEPNPAARGECCRDPMERLGDLVGISLGPSFPLAFKQGFGGPLGCSHITTLMQELSAVVTRLQRRRPDPFGHRSAGERLLTRSVFLDGVTTPGSFESEISVRVAELELDGVDERGDERFHSYGEARLVARTDLVKRTIASLEAGQRERDAAAPEASAWLSRSDDVAGFVGGSLSGGMARRCLEQFGGEPNDELLLSALLHLSPGITQVAAALADSIARSQGPPGENRPLPAGGGPCYMLRTDGPLMARIMGGNEPPGD